MRYRVYLRVDGMYHWLYVGDDDTYGHYKNRVLEEYDIDLDIGLTLLKY